jgi:hypothetical protein
MIYGSFVMEHIKDNININININNKSEFLLFYWII